jgi:hypothetical protein
VARGHSIVSIQTLLRIEIIEGVSGLRVPKPCVHSFLELFNSLNMDFTDDEPNGMVHA